MKIFFLVGAVFILSACSSGDGPTGNGYDSSALNEENINQALSGKIDGISCVQLARKEVSQYGPAGPYLTRPYPGGLNLPFDALAPSLIRAGMVEQVQSPNPSVTAFVWVQFKDEALKHLSVKQDAGGFEMLMICGGQEKVNTIENFTIPGESGAQTSEVTFTWTIDENSRLPAAWADLFQDLQFEGSGTRTVELTNNGWQMQQQN
jgi:hypothetical protein